MAWKKTEMGVIHYLASQSGLWIQVVSQETELSEDLLLQLHGLGSIYLNDQRLLDHPQIISGDYLRIHSQPRRFPIPETLELKKRIIFENEDLIVLDKPAGIPCHPTVDNSQENLISYFKLQTDFELLLTHRLDVPTTGLLVFAKNKKAQKDFHEILKKREIKKIYQAKVEAPGVPEGMYEHHMLKTEFAPKEIRHMASEQTQVCQMRVLKNQIKGSESRLTIELLTGRTHQIRAQLSFLGFPILGDQLYKTGSNKKPDFEIGLRCISLEFTWNKNQIKIDNW